MKLSSGFLHGFQGVSLPVMAVLLQLLASLLQLNTEALAPLEDPIAIQVQDKCICNTIDGQFVDTIVIAASSGLTWNLISQNNATLLGLGVETPTGSGIYKFAINVTSSNPYFINLVSSRLDYVTIESGGCNYNSAYISGPVSVCLNNISQYTISNKVAGTEYTWQIDGATLLSETSDTATVMFGALAGKFVLHALPVNGQCAAPISLEIVTGDPVNTAFGCINQINVSLDNNCEKTINIGDVLAGNLAEGTAAALVLEDSKGKILPGNRVNQNHIGQLIKARIVDGCGGNSCWGSVLVEDKSPPVLSCPQSIILECYKSQKFPGPQVVSECSGYQIYKLGSDIVTELTCDPIYLRKLSRKSIAIDAFDNRSDTCTQDIYIKRFPSDEILFPKDITLSCIEVQALDLDPKTTGYPSIYDLILDQFDYSQCKISFGYEDTEIKLPGKRKIVRKWKMYEWSCDTIIIRTDDQIIVIDDQLPPEILKCPKPLKLTTSIHTCSAFVNLAKLSENDIRENCNGTYSIDILYPGGIFKNVNFATQTLVELPIGSHDIIYTVTDASGLSSQCTTNILVEDHTPPVAVCIDSIVLSLASNFSIVNPKMLDNGSYDACGLSSLKVRRVDYIPIDSSYKDTIHVSCIDINTRVLVELEVTDVHGNTNICMTSILVEDKTPPSLTIPEDITISCTEWLNVKDITKFGQATVYAKCNVELVEKVDTFLNVCKSGRLDRSFTATSGKFIVTKVQHIYIVASPTFNPDSIHAPEDLTIENMCTTLALHPDSLAKINPKYGKPIIINDGCDLIGVQYSDKIYDIGGGTGNCSKIIRTWKILNYCVGDGSTVVREMTQLIKLVNTIPPKISIGKDTLTFKTLSCISNPITLNATASDDCTLSENLQWQWRIVNKLGLIVSSGTSIGGNITITNSLSTGNYDVIWVVNDQCANYTERKQTIQVINDKGATIFAYDTIVTALTAMVNTEMSCVNVKNLIFKSEHPCGYEIKYSFSPTDLTDTIKCFDCSNRGYNSVIVYGVDPYGTAGSAKVVINVQDNNNVNLCTSYEECIIWPSDTTISACTINLDPSTIGSLPRVKNDCQCQDFEVSYVDTLLSNVTCVGIERTFTVTFACDGISSFKRKQIVSAINKSRPKVSCPVGPIHLTATVGCAIVASIAAPTVQDSTCHTGLTTRYKIGNGSIISGQIATGTFQVGATEVTYYVHDACGNMDSCKLDVVVGDGAPPICRLRNITINLNGSGSATIADPSVFNNGTFDACNNLPFTFSLSRSTFTCDDLTLSIPVDLTVSDASGNSTTCTANVTTLDTIKPICTIKDITIDITTEQPFFILTPDKVIMNVTDNCTMQDTIMSKLLFTCADLGNQILRVVVRDKSGNSSSCEANVTVRDKIAPVCQLKSDTVFVNGGIARIDSSNINKGSFDPCGSIVSFSVSPNSFTCADIGMQRVTATIKDAEGNTSICDTTIFIVDGGNPICTAKDITIYLDQNGSALITPDDVDNGSGTGCNNALNKSISRNVFTCADIGQAQDVILSITNPVNNLTISCTSKVTVLDTLNPSLICPPEEITISCATYEGSIPNNLPRAIIVGTCNLNGFTLDSTIIKLTRPCNRDTFTRTYRLLGASGNLLNTCVQTIRVVNDDTMTMDDFILPPPILTVNNCRTLDPAQLEGGSVRLKSNTTSKCTALNISFTDSFPGNTCNDTLTRTWTILDSCETFSPLHYVQKIVIFDNIPPTIVGTKEILLFNEGQCGRFVSFDDLTISDCDSKVKIKNINPIGADTSLLNPEGFYPIGISNVIIIATDKCGNTSTDTLIVDIRDTITFAVTCVPIQVQIEQDGIARVNASDMITVFGDACKKENYNFRAVIRKGPGSGDTSSVVAYRCDQLINSGGILVLKDTLMIDIYNTVNGIDTLFDRCTSVATITDSSGNCAASLSMVRGTIMTEMSTYVPNFKVSAENEGDIKFVMTDGDGKFSFQWKKGRNIFISPEKMDDVRAGVNTLDLLHIQRHILRISLLDSPYKRIAADVNNDAIINVADMYELQNLILGKTEVFKNNTSWKAIDANYQFIDLANPLLELYPTSYEIPRLVQDMEVNFTAVKIGDVNNSYHASSANSIVERQSAELVVNETSFDNGEKTFEIELPGNETWAALQMSLDIGQAIVASVENMETEKPINFFAVDHTLRIVVINENYDTRRSEKATKIRIKLKTNDPYQKLILYKKGPLENILFDGNLRPQTFRLIEGLTKQVGDQLEVSQNYPNPWSESTTIDVNAPEEQVFIVTIRDVTGRLVLSRQYLAPQGKSQFSIDRHEVKEPGIYILELCGGKTNKSIKMIVTR